MSGPDDSRRRLRRRQKDPEGRMPVMDHLRELRKRIVLMVLIVAVGAVVGWFIYRYTLDFLKHPYCNVPSQYRYTPNGAQKCVLIFHAPLDGFTTHLKVAVLSGAVFTAPIWLYQIWAFITPGLRRNERRYAIGFIISSSLLFFAGVALAYLVLNKGLRFLLGQAGYGVQAQLTINDYISFITLMLVIFGLAFELPLIVVMANFAGVLPAKWLKKTQRVAIFLIFLFAAVATPSTDPISMCAMAVPMVVLFEAAVLVAVVHDKRKARRKAEERAVEGLDDDTPSEVDPVPRSLEPSGDSRGDWSDTT